MNQSKDRKKRWKPGSKRDEFNEKGKKVRAKAKNVSRCTCTFVQLLDNTLHTQNVGRLESDLIRVN